MPGGAGGSNPTRFMRKGSVPLVAVRAMRRFRGPGWMTNFAYQQLPPPCKKTCQMGRPGGLEKRARTLPFRHSRWSLESARYVPLGLKRTHSQRNFRVNSALWWTISRLREFWDSILSLQHSVIEQSARSRFHIPENVFPQRLLRSRLGGHP